MYSNYVLTISIAAFNVQNFIKESLDSIINCKSFDLIEVIVVNDGSTDNTQDLLNEYSVKYPNIKVINKHNAGWGSTLNSSILVAKGKYFKQLDGDDVVNTNNLNEFILFLKQNDADYIISPYSVFRDSDNKVISTISYDTFPNSEQCITTDKLIDYLPNFQMHASCFRTSLLQKNNICITERCFYTDVEFMVKSLSFCSTALYFLRPIYMYRVGLSGQSVSIAGMKKHYKEHQQIVCLLLDYLAKIKVNENLKKFISNRVTDMVYANYDFLLFSDYSKKDLVLYDNYIKKFENIYLDCRLKRVHLLRKIKFHFLVVFKLFFICKNYFSYNLISVKKFIKFFLLKR